MAVQHWLVVPTEPDDGMGIEHGYGCPSMLVVDPWWAGSGVGCYETVHLCYLDHYDREIGLDEFKDLPPSRYEIEEWHARYETRYGTEWDAGINLVEDPADAAVSL